MTLFVLLMLVLLAHARIPLYTILLFFSFIPSPFTVLP